MIKDIEWLKKEIWKQDIVMDKGYIYTDDLMSIINELDGYEVEKEPLFYVPTGIDKRGLYENYLAKDHLGSIDVEWADETYFKNDKNAERYRFTEQEIRSIPKGDIYFKYFAVPVEVAE